MQAVYDVVVIGGGTAGTMAAIQAARAGARTLLLEKNGILGGTMTVGGINYPAHFFAWGQQAVGGIGWELLCKTYAETGQALPRPENGSRHVTLDAVLFAALADEAVTDAGCELLFHAMPTAVERQADGWQVSAATKTGVHTFHARVLIDATGDANVVSLAGFDVVRSPVVQPATLSFRCSGYDAEALDYAALKTAADQAVKEGRLLSTDVAWDHGGPRALLRKHGNNANHILAPDAHTSEGRTRAELEGRRSLLRLYRFLRRQPGLQDFCFDWVCGEIGIRETVTIKGKHTIRVEDYESGRTYADAICYAFYPIDEHLNNGQGINKRNLQAGVLPSIPRGALLPEGSRNLIVAGRCLASDREANSALRVECPCMAMGQAAGAMAALSARIGQDPEALPMEAIRALLRDHGAVVPD